MSLSNASCCIVQSNYFSAFSQSCNERGSVVYVQTSDNCIQIANNMYCPSEGRKIVDFDAFIHGFMNCEFDMAFHNLFTI